jgi:ABC-type glycerol-3-phosphate transport system substrate-binding protein
MRSQDYAATQSAFLAGKGAMYAMGNWFAAAADDPKTKPPFDIGQFFWPSDDGKLVVPTFTGGGLLVKVPYPIRATLRSPPNAHRSIVTITNPR